jgi:hypothetical protein
MLHEAPASLQRTIARVQRISLPRRCTPDERHARLRRALCRSATVRATYASLDSTVQAALQELRTMRRGLAPAEVARRYGAIRSWRQLAADPRPRTIAEQLVLLGWLLPRPAAPQHPPCFRMPPELRRWLPHPLALDVHGPAPAAPMPPVVRATATILLACADRPLPLCADGVPRAASMRLLGARLAPAAGDDVASLVAWLLPLLLQLGLLESRGQRATLTLAGQRWLAQPAGDQLDALRAAWLHTPAPDQMIARLLPKRAGIDWPLLRRKLCGWVAALPPDQWLAADALYPALARTFGPLADAQTHGFRTVARTPWGPHRSAAVFAAMLHGPLQWLGYVADCRLQIADCRLAVCRPSSIVHRPSPARWRYGAPGMLHVPHAAADVDVLRLLPFARWHAADADATIYQITPATLARAASAGWDATALWSLLEQRAGVASPCWNADLPAASPPLQIIPATVLLADDPAVLQRALRSRTVQRYVTTRLAPGIALTRPEHVAPLQRALQRQQISAPVEMSRRGAAAAERGGSPQWSPGDCAALALACAFYRQHAPPDAPLLPHDQLEGQLRRALPPALLTALDAAVAQVTAPSDPPRTPPVDDILPLHDRVQQLRRASAAEQMVVMTYNKGAQGTWTRRVVRPLSVEQRGQHWHLRAYCTARRAERTFRVDRIGAIERMQAVPAAARPPEQSRPASRPSLIRLE